jgi:hypothetical protein
MSDVGLPPSIAMSTTHGLFNRTAQLLKHTVDGCEILRQLISDLPHYLQVFYHPKWRRISQPSTVENLVFHNDTGEPTKKFNFSCGTAEPNNTNTLW